MRRPLLTLMIATALLNWLGTGMAQEATPAKDAPAAKAPAQDAEPVKNAPAAKAPAQEAEPGKNEPAAKVPAEGADWTVPDLGMEFVWVAALKLHVGKYEVTNGEYRKKEPKHKFHDFEGHALNGDRQPVVYINFDDAKAYAAWLTERERTAGRLPVGWQYRLPTETEWQAFAQCGDNREYPWGNDWPPKYGNYGDRLSTFKSKIQGYDDGFAVTCPVEKSGKNDWNLYGVGGNVFECASDNAGGFGAWRSATWRDYRPENLRCAYRYVDRSSVLSVNGFRVVLSH